MTATLAHGDDRVDYNRDIRPILSDHCFYCHGFDEANRQADLRLDTYEHATDYAVVPGRPEDSEIMNRMLSDDPDSIMPPPDTEKQLSREQLDLVRRWIEQGAEYQTHWAWSKLTRPEVPGQELSSHESIEAGATAIDAFLQRGWRESGAQSVAVATPRERLRRLSFDLRGIMPNAEEVASFEQSPTEQAFFEFRGRWMSEIAYAEHQAVRWLDLVRWADTSGFVSDEPIASGAYRGWIIRAIHANQPFDQFSIEQLAGDLLPDPSDDQWIASGYNRIVNTNCEAGGIEEEQLYKLKGEHVRALGTVWLGMTTGCAECHDHKFDPFSSKDYYSLAAFFDDLVEAGVYTPGDRREPLHYVHRDSASSTRDAQLVKRMERLKKRIARAGMERFTNVEDETKRKLADQASRGDFVWFPARLPAVRVLQGQANYVLAEEKLARKTVAQPGQFHRHHAAESMTGYLTTGGNQTDSARDAFYAEVWLDEQHRPDMIGLQISNGDYGRLGWQTSNYETYFWGDDTSGKLATPQPWSSPERVKRLGDMPSQSGWVRLRVPFEQLIKPVPGKAYEKVGLAWLHTGGRVRWGDSGLELRKDKITALELGETAIRKWWERPFNRQFYQQRAESVAKAFLTSRDQRDDLQKELVHDALREKARPEMMKQLRELESELFILRSQALPVLVSRQADARKVTRLLHRGDYQDRSGPILMPAFPEFLAVDSHPRMLDGVQGDGGELSPRTRLDLAQWLFDEASPLVARVYVNRLWHQFFGRGLSETLEDSGVQGDWPSHVELLDWLACEFRDSGWDRHHMVRLLTSTKAYQLSSKPTEELAQRDPTNRLHARQSRFRLPAEAIRDVTLQAAGMLQTTTEIPTESFFPYQPSAYWTRSDKIMYGSRHMVWVTSEERSQYGRSLYTFWKRQNIHPTMLAFDAPTRQECTAKRNITNTPGQALTLLNDPVFVEAARVLAARDSEGQGLSAKWSDDERLDRLFAWTLQRQPSAAEKAILKELLDEQREHFRRYPEDAMRLVAVGQAPAPSEEQAPQIAAWTAVTRSILNLHEFLSRP